LKKKVKTPKVAQKPLKIIVLKYWLQYTARKKKLVLATRILMSLFPISRILCEFFTLNLKIVGFIFLAILYSQLYETII
jgi:hypothetical protein